MARASRQVVLVTGISGGIGAAVAKRFSAMGWIVAGTVRSRRGGSGMRGKQYDLQPADMTRPADLERVVATVWRTYGRLDALICSAGYGLVGPIDSLEYAQMRDQLTVNTLAPAELIRQVVPLMRQQGKGVIAVVSSLSGRVGIPGYSAYAASKFALEGLCESADLELRPAGIRVKLLEPSRVNTAFWTNLKRGSARKWRDAELGLRYGLHFEGGAQGVSAATMAEEVYRAVTDGKSKLHYPLGSARYVLLLKKILPESWYRSLWRRVIM